MVPGTQLQATTDAPMSEALGELMRHRGLGLSSLAGLLRAEGVTIGRTRLAQLQSGKGAPPSPEQMERLAGVLGVSPAFFAEYRLWRTRSLLDPAVVGFDRAMANLHRLRGRRALEEDNAQAHVSRPA
jgi:transcriptional regulator with XRE-family HTH domain